MPTKESEPEATSIPQEKPKVPVDQVCEPAITSMTVGVLVDLDSKE